jgi:hypothetical protein
MEEIQECQVLSDSESPDPVNPGQEVITLKYQK